MRFTLSPLGSAPTTRSALEETRFYEQWAGGIPALLRFLQQDMSYEGPRSTDPETLEQVAAPVLLLRGEQTLLGTFFAAVERYVAQHVVDAHVRALPGVSLAPLLEPEPIARRSPSSSRPGRCSALEPGAALRRPARGRRQAVTRLAPSWMSKPSTLGGPFGDRHRPVGGLAERE